MNLKMLLTLEYWTAIRPLAQDPKTSLIFVAFFAVLLALSFAFRSAYRKLKKTDRFVSYAWRKGSSACLWLGIAGLVMTFFRYQGAPLFGMRIWYIVWIVSAIVWTASILWYRYKELPKLLAEHHEAAVK